MSVTSSRPPTFDRETLMGLLGVASDAARAGGSEVVRHFRDLDTVAVRDKAAGDYVTDADLASEAAIRAVLAEMTPGFAVLGEEGGGPRSWESWIAPTWVVDPLDGTTNFVRGLPMVGVSIGLVVDGSPVVGVVHAPMLGLTFSAALACGARLHTRAEDPSSATVPVPLVVSKRPVRQALCGHGFLPRARRAGDEGAGAMIEHVLSEVEDLRRIGSASLDLAWTAAGSLDGFFHRSLGTWDVAAGALLVREAGGVVTDYAGDDRAWLLSGDIVAGSPACHEFLLSAASASAAAASAAAAASRSRR